MTTVCTALIGALHSGPIAFQNTSGEIATKGLSIAFQNTSYNIANSGLSIAFQNTSYNIANSGLSVAFQTATDMTGRGVTVSFGTLPPPTQPPPTTIAGTSPRF